MAGGGTTAAVGGVALAIGVACGWWLGATASDRIAAEHLQTIAKVEGESQATEARLAEAESRAKRQTAQVAEIESKLRAAEKEAAALKTSLDAATASLDEARAALPKTAAPAEPVRKGPRFAFEEFAKLADVDWKGVGEHLNAMSPLCGEIVAAIAKGEDAMAAQGKAAQHNGFLINAALKIAGQVPGTGVNGAFTHPSVQANAIAAALDAAGKPLTPEQAAALEQIARRFADEDARRLQGYAEGTFGLQKVIDEADVRRRFYDAAFAALSEEQRNALTSPAAKGLLGLDLYSDGLLWATVMRTVQYRDAASFTDAVTNTMQGGLKIPKESAEALRGVVAAWQRDLPATFVNPAPGAPAENGPFRVEAVRVAAAKTLALVQSIVAELKLEGPAAAQARRWPTTLLPVRGSDD